MDKIDQTRLLAYFISEVSTVEPVVDLPIVQAFIRGSIHNDMRCEMIMTPAVESFFRQMDFFLTLDGSFRKSVHQLVRAIIALHPKGWKVQIKRTHPDYRSLSKIALEEFSNVRVKML